MKSLSYVGDGLVRQVEVDDPQPGPGEALIRIEASALCGSERGALMGGVAGNLGHEAAGTVLDPGTSTFSPGDRVGIAAVVGCGECERCTVGQELHCRRGFRSSSSSGGLHAELATVTVSALRELPAGIDAGAAAMLSGDALGVPVRGLRRARSEPGESVLVIGLGPVGLGHVLVRAFSGAEVIAMEPSTYRRGLARDLGAAKVLAPGEDIGVRPRVVIEATGRPECIRQAFDLVDNGGVVLQSGECRDDVGINPSDLIIRREITYTGAWYYASEDYPDMRGLFDRGLPIQRLCTHEVAASDAQPAVNDFIAGNSGKVIVRWS